MLVRDTLFHHAHSHADVRFAAWSALSALTEACGGRRVAAQLYELGIMRTAADTLLDTDVGALLESCTPAAASVGSRSWMDITTALYSLNHCVMTMLAHGCDVDATDVERQLEWWAQSRRCVLFALIVAVNTYKSVRAHARTLIPCHAYAHARAACTG